MDSLRINRLQFWKFVSKVAYLLSKGPRLVVIFSGLYLLGCLAGAVLALVH
jgi:hypothetical protein